jgi:uncharacterized protein (DUF305 family)
MNQRNHAHWLAAIGVAAALAAASLPVTAHEAPSKAGGHSGPSMEMHKNMMKGMKEMQGMKPSGNIDHDFAMMMRHHHQQGVEMAQHQIKHGKDPKMREMAQKIMDSQKKEIAEFDEWMKSSSGHGGKK